MIFTASLGRGLQLGAYHVEARSGDNASWVESANATTPTPTPQLTIVEPVVYPTATPTPTTKEMIIAEIVEVFGEDAPDAFNVLYCENRGLNPEAINHNRNGSIDYSIFQINDIHTKRFGNGFKTDWKENIRVARVLQKEQGWRIWSCSERINVTPFWKD